LLCDADFRAVRFGLVRFGLVRAGLARFGLARFHLATFGWGDLVDLTARIRDDRRIRAQLETSGRT